MRLNLGCGRDVREGYVNVDLFPPADQIVDLSKTPWPWADVSADEILMLDFLEHFPYAQTGEILVEAWRVLKPTGMIEVQVPDFKHCAYAILRKDNMSFQCNRCGEWLTHGMGTVCPSCDQTVHQIQDAAIHRLFGGQDRPGNWHYTTFTEEVLTRHLQKCGFGDVSFVERDHQTANWNIKARATKMGDIW